MIKEIKEILENFKKIQKKLLVIKDIKYKNNELFFYVDIFSLNKNGKQEVIKDLTAKYKYNKLIKKYELIYCYKDRMIKADIERIIEKDENK